MRRLFTAVAALTAALIASLTMLSATAGELDQLAASVNDLARRIVSERPAESSDILAQRIWSELERDAARSKWPLVRQLALSNDRAEKRRHHFLQQLAHGGYVANVSISPTSSALIVAHDGRVAITPAVAEAIEVLFSIQNLAPFAPYVIAGQSQSWTPGWVYFGVPVVRPASLAGMFDVLDPACAMTRQRRLDVVVANEVANALLYPAPVNHISVSRLTDILAAATNGVPFESRDEAHEFVSDAASVLADSCGWTIVLTHLVFAALSSDHDSHAPSAMFLLREIEAQERRLSIPDAAGIRAGLLRARAMQDPSARRRQIDAVLERTGAVLRKTDFTKRVQAAYRTAARDILRALQQ